MSIVYELQYYDETKDYWWKICARTDLDEIMKEHQHWSGLDRQAGVSCRYRLLTIEDL